jgi:rhomboid protease GluP
MLARRRSRAVAYAVAVSEPGEVLVRHAPSRERADEWALVLAAEGLSARVRAERGWGVWTREEEAERADALLDDYLSENRRPPPEARHPEWSGSGPLSWALLVAAGLLLFFRWTGPAAAGSVWFERGAADAHILAGEPWRAVTALTLHADASHVLSNAVAGALFLGLVFRALGPGLGAALVLAAGALGNLANAWLHSAAHVSVGASTAVFGAVGILAGVAGARRRASLARARRPWMTAAAGLALLAMLGTGGERTDLWAHAFGLLAGGALGWAAGAGLQRPPRLALQWAAGALCVAAVLGAWRLALHGPGV